MSVSIRLTLSVAGALLFAAAATADTSIVKKPDLGNFWNPLGNNGNTPVYADSFIAPEADTSVQRIGTWLDDLGSGGNDLRFEIWGDAGGPNPSDVIATTGTVSPVTGAGLFFNEFATGGGTLTPGNTYWFVATAVGEQGAGFWQVGGHTQNSEYQDNGTFWYSNDPDGINFDGQNLTPEMAFSVSLGPRGCYADFTDDGVLDLFDFLAFVNSFNAGENRANCDGEGGLDLFDFLCYTNAFNEGC